MPTTQRFRAHNLSPRNLSLLGMRQLGALSSSATVVADVAVHRTAKPPTAEPSRATTPPNGAQGTQEPRQGLGDGDAGPAAPELV